MIKSRTLGVNFYNDKNGTISLQLLLNNQGETVWLTQSKSGTYCATGYVPKLFFSSLNPIPQDFYTITVLLEPGKVEFLIRMSFGHYGQNKILSRRVNVLLGILELNLSEAWLKYQDMSQSTLLKLLSRL